MDTWGIIATWKMSLEGVLIAAAMLEEGEPSGDGVVTVIKNVEDNPDFPSAGYGGLPNVKGVVELDAAYMDGNNLNVGAVAAIRNYANPILIARALSGNRMNSFLVGNGAEAYAAKMGFTRRRLLTAKSRKKWQERLATYGDQMLSSYDGHDTIGCVCLDRAGGVTAGTSTSGLFMKQPGRVGDSPLVGSGFYAESGVGGACATGVGEDIMKGCLSYEVVRLLSAGMKPREAARAAYENFLKKYLSKIGKPGNMSVICLNRRSGERIQGEMP